MIVGSVTSSGKYDMHIHDDDHTEENLEDNKKKKKKTSRKQQENNKDKRKKFNNWINDNKKYNASVIKLE